MLIKYLSKSLFLKTILVLLDLAIALTLYPFAKNLNLADVQDKVKTNTLYFPAINIDQDRQTTISITNTECKCNQRRANVTHTAYENDGSSLGVVKDITRLRANKTKTVGARTLPIDIKSLTVESNGNLICNAVFKTIDVPKSKAFCF